MYSRNQNEIYSWHSKTNGKGTPKKHGFLPTQVINSLLPIIVVCEAGAPSWVMDPSKLKLTLQP